MMMMLVLVLFLLLLVRQMTVPVHISHTSFADWTMGLKSLLWLAVTRVLPGVGAHVIVVIPTTATAAKCCALQIAPLAVWWSRWR